MIKLKSDLFGEKPIYFYWDRKNFFYSTSVRTLLRNRKIKKTVDLNALNEYLSYSFVPPPRTIYKFIFKIPPACELTYRNGQIKLKKYWRIKYRAGLARSEKYYSQKIKEYLSNSIKGSLSKDFGVLLSGGVDSGSLVAICSRMLGKRIKTFSASVPYFDESADISAVATKYQTHHRTMRIPLITLSALERVIQHLDEPCGNSSLINEYYLLFMAKDHTKTILTGTSADALFAGHDFYLSDLNIIGLKKIPSVLRILTDRLLPQFHKPGTLFLKRALYRTKKILGLSLLPEADIYEKRRDLFSLDLKKVIFKQGALDKLGSNLQTKVLANLFNQCQSQNYLDRALYADLKGGVVGLLVKMNMLSAIYQLEIINPFLDKKLIEFAANIPWQMKVREGEIKYIFKKAVKGLIPIKIIEKEKRGFVYPVSVWYEKYEPEIRNILLSEDEYFSRKGIIELIEMNQASQYQYSDHLFCLLTLKLWLKNKF